MLLSDNKQLFVDIVREISEKNNVLPIYIEKDFFAISILKKLVSLDSNFVFKGGTSLSVCYNAINRFSEDVDLSYEDESISASKRRKIKQTIIEVISGLSLTLTNSDDIRSRRDFNRYICSYNSFLNQDDDHIILEWSTITPSFPTEKRSAQTIIGKFLEQNGRYDLVKQYNLESFCVKTMSMERTMIDKIFAICDYHISGFVDRESRHLYDIHKLLMFVKLDKKFLSLFCKVRDCRKSLNRCYSAKDGHLISFLLYDLIGKATFKTDYIQKTSVLLYYKTSYDECVVSILKVADYLKDNNL